MRVGIMGGTLDPVHNGHIMIAKAAMDALSLDRIMLLPAGDPPHKCNPTHRLDRFEMARLAAGEIEGIFACGIEIFRDGTTYTVDTLRELRAWNPNTQWYYLIGADTLDVLDTWRDFASVAGMCTFVVIGRAEENANPAKMEQLQRLYGAEFVVLPLNGPDISSTEVRARVARGVSVDGMLPTAVADYIREKGLYLCAFSKESLLARLKEMIRDSRYEHTLGVAETAKRLAPGFGIDPMRAELAALLHDCAKSMPLTEMQACVRREVPDADAEELATECVLHAPAGSVLAKEIFGVQDPEILSAIRKHTIGDANMSPMEALIYTADFIEPGRKPFPGLDEARALAEHDLYAAMRKCAVLSSEYLRDQHKRAHPKTEALIRNFG